MERKQVMDRNDAERVAGRYRLGEPLGAGSAGEVIAAVDEILGTEVAVKLLWDSADATSASARRENAALRLLRVPGTTHLLDEGHHRGRRFLIMARVRGTPFPGGSAPIPWERLRSTVVTLLETLSRVHSMGIIHGDLKPANVLVAEDGRPTVLDFGLARGPGVHAGRETGGSFAGTPSTMAPEAFFGAPPSPRGDLYSVGVMVFEAVTGVSPHRAPDLASLALARRSAPPLPSSLVPDIPPEVDRICEALLDPDPIRRPANGGAALSLLARGEVREMEVLPADSRDLFHGPDLILRLRERGAEELDRRTGNRPDLRAAELAAWERAGLTIRDGAKWRLDHHALDWLRLGIPVRPGAEPLPGFASGFLELAREGRDREAAREGEAIGVRVGIEEGMLADAMHLWREALAAARRAEDASIEADLLGRLVQGSMLMQSREWTALTAYEAERRLSDDTRTRSVATLARVSWHFTEGHFDRAEVEVAAVESFPEEHLEWARLALQGFALRVRDVDAYRAFLDSIEERWSPSSKAPTEIEAALLLWRAHVAFQMCRLDDSARLRLESARRTRWMPKRTMALIEAAAALAESGRIEEVRELLPEIQALAMRCRRPEFEHFALTVWRLAQIVTGDLPIEPAEFAEVNATLQSATLYAETFRINEVGLRWRRGDLEGARQVYRPYAQRIATHRDLASGRFFYVGIARALGEPSPRVPREALAEAAIGSEYPAMALQALALFALDGSPIPPHWKSEAVRLRDAVHYLPGDLRREMMTLDDAMEVLAGRRGVPTPERPWASGFPRDQVPGHGVR